VLVRKVYLHKFLDVVKTQLDHALSGRNVTLAMQSDYTGVAYFDERSMLRLVHNLARNAADAMPSGGTFTITTRADDDHVRFEFADTGQGIPQEMEGRLFEMFATRKDGGTGLGLAIVKKIVDDHNGIISYNSEESRGTTFRVMFPRERPVGVPEKTGEMPIFKNR